MWRLPCGVFFDADHVYVIDLQKQRVVSKGPQNKGLSVSKDHVLEVYFSNMNVAASEELWHHRFAHSNSSVLQQLRISKEIEVNKTRSFPVCQPCRMGKSSRLQFFLLVLVIHCDLWGLSPVGWLHMFYLVVSSSYEIIVLSSLCCLSEVS